MIPLFIQIEQKLTSQLSGVTSGIASSSVLRHTNSMIDKKGDIVGVNPLLQTFKKYILWQKE